MQVYQPVCSTDGGNFSNKCFASLAGATVAYKGKCETPPSGGCDCPKIHIHRFPLGRPFVWKNDKVEVVKRGLAGPELGRILDLGSSVDIKAVIWLEI